MISESELFMSNQQETKHGGLMAKHPESETRPTDVLSEQEIVELEKAGESATGLAGKRTWPTIMLWLFIAASFAALVFVGYLTWHKCRGTSPF